MNYRCEFYDDKKCQDTKKYFELIESKKADEDLTEQREELCSQRNPVCTIRQSLLADSSEAK